MRQVLLAVVATFILAACSNSKVTRITGTFTDPDQVCDSIRVVYGDDESFKVAVKPETASFLFAIPTKLTYLCSIETGLTNIDGTPYEIPFIPEGKNLDFQIAGPDEVEVRVSGHSATKDYLDFNEKCDAIIESYSDGYEEIVSQEGEDEEEIRYQLEQLTKKITEQINEQALATAALNMDNIVGAIALTSANLDEDVLYEELLQLSEPVKEVPEVAKIIAGIEERVKSVGAPFKDFTVVQDEKHPETSTVKFSDYVGKGKFVLVDFWASWCGPCRREIPNIKNVYEAYKSDTFEVLSVAVWDEPDASLKAIKELGMTWPQIINAGSVPTDLYGIEGIPHIMLIGPDGTILKRNLRGSDIENAVIEFVCK